MYYEQIVPKRKSLIVSIVSFFMIVCCIIIGFLIMISPLGIFGPITIAAMIYGIYRYVTAHKIEFEYLATDGHLDIDQIIDKKRRKRLFSQHCKDFEDIGPLKDIQDVKTLAEGRKLLCAIWEISTGVDGIYFVKGSYKNEKMLILFQPDKEILDMFRQYLPQKLKLV
jgi:hypothetical protein